MVDTVDIPVVVTEPEREFPWVPVLVAGGVALATGLVIGYGYGYSNGHVAGSFDVMKDAVKANAALHKAAMSAASTHLPG